MGKPSQLRRNRKRMTRYNIEKASVELTKKNEYIEILQLENVKLQLEILHQQVDYGNKELVDNLKKENADLKAKNLEVKLSLDNLENVHREKVSSLKDNFNEQHKYILSNQTKAYKLKLDEVLDRQSILQSRILDTEKKNSFLREQVDALLNQNKILNTKLTHLNDLTKIFPCQSSPIDLTMLPSLLLHQVGFVGARI